MMNKSSMHGILSCGRELVFRHCKMKWFCVVVVCLFVFFSQSLYFCAKAMNTGQKYLNTWIYLTSGNLLLFSAPPSVIILERSHLNMPRIYEGACMRWRYKLYWRGKCFEILQGVNRFHSKVVSPAQEEEPNESSIFKKYLRGIASNLSAPHTGKPQWP